MDGAMDGLLWMVADVRQLLALTLALKEVGEELLWCKWAAPALQCTARVRMPSTAQMRGCPLGCTAYSIWWTSQPQND